MLPSRFPTLNQTHSSGSKYRFCIVFVHRLIAIVEANVGYSVNGSITQGY